jgi:hypothetical protein
LAKGRTHEETALNGQRIQEGEAKQQKLDTKFSAKSKRADAPPHILWLAGSIAKTYFETEEDTWLPSLLNTCGYG